MFRLSSFFYCEQLEQQLGIKSEICPLASEEADHHVQSLTVEEQFGSEVIKLLLFKKTF